MSVAMSLSVSTWLWDNLSNAADTANHWVLLVGGILEQWQLHDLQKVTKQCSERFDIADFQHRKRWMSWEGSACCLVEISYWAKPGAVENIGFWIFSWIWMVGFWNVYRRGRHTGPSLTSHYQVIFRVFVVCGKRSVSALVVIGGPISVTAHYWNPYQ